MMSSRHFAARLFACIAVCATLSRHVAIAHSDPTPKGWLTYINTKYDFDICYPASLRVAAQTAAGDGQTFTGPDGGTLTVFWRPGSDGDTLAKTMAGEVAAMGPSPMVTYTAGHAGWAVRSGRQENSLFYVKAMKRDSDTLIMEVKYPLSAASNWNQWVGHFAACFESSRPK